MRLTRTRSCRWIARRKRVDGLILHCGLSKSLGKMSLSRPHIAGFVYIRVQIELHQILSYIQLNERMEVWLELVRVCAT
jgi:hypothetical protein